MQGLGLGWRVLCRDKPGGLWVRVCGAGCVSMLGQPPPTRKVRVRQLPAAPDRLPCRGRKLCRERWSWFLSLDRSWFISVGCEL